MVLERSRLLGPDQLAKAGSFLVSGSLVPEQGSEMREEELSVGVQRRFGGGEAAKEGTAGGAELGSEGLGGGGSLVEERGELGNDGAEPNAKGRGNIGVSGGWEESLEAEEDERDGGEVELLEGGERGHG